MTLLQFSRVRKRILNLYQSVDPIKDHRYSNFQVYSTPRRVLKPFVQQNGRDPWWGKLFWRGHDSRLVFSSQYTVVESISFFCFFKQKIRTIFMQRNNYQCLKLRVSNFQFHNSTLYNSKMFICRWLKDHLCLTTDMFGQHFVFLFHQEFVQNKVSYKWIQWIRRACIISRADIEKKHARARNPPVDATSGRRQILRSRWIRTYLAGIRKWLWDQPLKSGSWSCIFTRIFEFLFGFVSHVAANRSSFIV